MFFARYVDQQTNRSIGALVIHRGVPVNLSLGRRTKFALGTLVAIVIAFLFVRVVVKWEVIGQVAPPVPPPSSIVDPAVAGNLTFEASAEFWQDFMPIVVMPLQRLIS